MQYRYAPDQNFEDYASGRVFYARPGEPAFPVRLASEIFQRALVHWKATGGRGRCTIYDPVCGSAYWLGVLTMLHRDAIAAIYASDIEAGVLSLAERNLSLTRLEGLDRRVAEIEAMMQAYHKESHASALESARKFRARLATDLGSYAIQIKVFQGDAANSQSMRRGLDRVRVDLVLADVPYGWHSQWQSVNAVSGEGLQSEQTPVWQMLAALYSLLEPGAVVAIAADKSQKAMHDAYHRLERFQVGKRRVFILAPQ